MIVKLSLELYRLLKWTRTPIRWWCSPPSCRSYLRTFVWWSPGEEFLKWTMKQLLQAFLKELDLKENHFHTTSSPKVGRDNHIKGRTTNALHTTWATCITKYVGGDRGRMLKHLRVSTRKDVFFMITHWSGKNCTTEEFNGIYTWKGPLGGVDFLKGWKEAGKDVLGRFWAMPVCHSMNLWPFWMT